MEIVEYFEETYIGRRLQSQTRRIPPFLVKLWNRHHQAIKKVPEHIMLLKRMT